MSNVSQKEWVNMLPEYNRKSLIFTTSGKLIISPTPFDANLFLSNPADRNPFVDLQDMMTLVPKFKVSFIQKNFMGGYDTKVRALYQKIGITEKKGRTKRSRIMFGVPVINPTTDFDVRGLRLTRFYLDNDYIVTGIPLRSKGAVLPITSAMLFKYFYQEHPGTRKDVLVEASLCGGEPIKLLYVKNTSIESIGIM